MPLGKVEEHCRIATCGNDPNELSNRGIAYLHLIEPRASSVGFADDASVDSADNASLFRHLFDGRMITAGGYTPEMGVAAVERGLADAVAFGRMFIANPDLPERIRTGAPLNAFDRSSPTAAMAMATPTIQHFPWPPQRKADQLPVSCRGVP
jgi:2,4-dienoyl-CoA reductase-like NADH-dependent reductase (Old Yellow Enzyme family)